ncbi:MAG: FtsH protease activity modulator HflK [Thiotrichales bacterium]|nr:FtsH protease activity modulator HflK [Thiotrichales bacterium]
MAWNEPGKPGQDPWGNSGNNGGGNSPRGPKRNGNDDLSQLLKKATEKFSGGDGSGGLNGKATVAILGVVGVVWMLSGIYIVDPAERGVVTRFGAYVEETKAGPHWHLPYPIENVRIVNVDQIRTSEIGYRSDGRNRSGSVASESLMLTQDENIVDLKIAVQYQVRSASDYLFQTVDPDESLRISVESALREVVGQNTMDFVLTEGRNDVVASVQQKAQERLDAYNTGILITSVNLQDAQPPEQVQAAFADVVKAREDRERLINEAEAYSNEILPVARGQAARQLEEASAYREQVIAQAVGESSRFVSIVGEYEKAPEVTRNRLYIDAVSNVLSSTSKVFVGSSGTNNLLYLPLDKMVGSGQATIPFKPQEMMPSTQSGSAANNGTASQPTSNIRELLRSRELR